MRHGVDTCLSSVKVLSTSPDDLVHTVLTSHTCVNDLMMCTDVYMRENSVFHSQSHSPITYVRNEYLCTEIRAAAYISKFVYICERICRYKRRIQAPFASHKHIW